MNIRVYSMHGLGDNIYQRACVKELCKQGTVYIDTSWPEIYKDLDVKFIKPRTSLRTQTKNSSRFGDDFWHEESTYSKNVRFCYGRNINLTTIQSAMEECAGVSGSKMDLPQFRQWFKTSKPIAIVRPVTERKEWLNTARNPLPEYVKRAAEKLSETHHIISIADLDEGQEWSVGGPIKADTRFDHGELDTSELIGLIQQSDIIVGSPGWIIPAAIAANKKAIIIAGGNGAINCPEKLDPDNRLNWLIPDNFCRCAQMNHSSCDKTISRFDEKLEEAICGK